MIKKENQNVELNVSNAKKARKLVHGVGLNDVKGAAGTKVYKRWASMLMRCYSEKFQLKNPTYRGCYICDSWLTFSNVKAFFDKIDRLIGHDSYEADKDLLHIGNKMYSPSTVLPVSAKLNTYLTDCAATRGDLLVGVTFKNDKPRPKPYEMKIADGNGKQIRKTFATEQEAHCEYIRLKREMFFMRFGNEFSELERLGLIPTGESAESLMVRIADERWPVPAAVDTEEVADEAAPTPSFHATGIAVQLLRSTSPMDFDDAADALALAIHYDGRGGAYVTDYEESTIMSDDDRKLIVTLCVKQHATEALLDVAAHGKATMFKHFVKHGVSPLVMLEVIRTVDAGFFADVMLAISILDPERYAELSWLVIPDESQGTDAAF